MTFDNKVRFLINLDRMARPGESLQDAAMRLAAALDAAGFRGYIMTAGHGNMNPIPTPASFGPEDEGATT